MIPCEGCGRPFTPKSKRQRFHSRKCQTRSRYLKTSTAEGEVHFIIPDTQVEPGRPIDHLAWIGQYARDRYAGKAVRRIMLGDHWNMGSLSSYDKKGGKQMEGRRVKADLGAGSKGFKLLDGPATEAERVLWEDELLLGNHEDRLRRWLESDAQLEGLLDPVHAFEVPDSWNVHEFLVPQLWGGVAYAHYFYNPMTGRPYGGANIETRIKTIGHSFTMGHQQGLKIGRIEGVYGARLGLVAGSCYLHDEDYIGPQGNRHWRGIVICNNVRNGEYDRMEVGLDYLCHRYEGVHLEDFTPRRFA